MQWTLIELEDILIAWLTIFAAALFIIALLSFRRTGHRKLLLITTAFGLFFAKGLLIALGFFFEPLPAVTGVSAILLDLVILLLFYLAIFRK